MEVSLNEFLSQFSNHKFYRLTDEKEKHRDIQYKTGLNEDCIAFNPSGSCQAGGLYFYIDFQLPRYETYSPDAVWIREVSWTDLSDVRIYLEEGKCKTNKFLLGERQKFENMYRFFTAQVTDVKNNAIYMRFIPPELYEAAVSQRGSALSFVPIDMMTPEICMAAVKEHGYALQYVPVELRTPELCLAAVTNRGSALAYVPVELRTSELCLISTHTGSSLAYVPIELKTPELCMAAVKGCGDDLQHVPTKLITPELCTAAVTNHGHALQYVPIELETPELYIIAVTKYAHGLYFVPTKHKTFELCLTAVTCHEDAIEYVPSTLRSRVLVVLNEKLKK